MKGLYFLAAAYTVIWVGLFVYLMSLGQRARRLEQELDALESDSGRRHS